MASIKGNRIVIASLFLPQGTVYYDDDPAVNDDVEADPLPPPAAQSRQAALKNALAAAGFSIVDDLTKANSPIPSPTEDKANPFSAFTSPRLAPTGAGLRPLPSRLPTLNLNAAASAVTPAKLGGDLVASLTDAAQPGPRPSQRKPRRMSRTQSRSSSMRRSSSVVRATPRVGVLDAPHYTPWQIEASAHSNTGLFNAMNSVGDAVRSKLWVGIIDSPTDEFSEDLKVDLELKYGSQHDSLPVWISDAEFTGCYDLYCHQVLWPTLHYAVPDSPKNRANFYDSKSFEQYAAVNQKFAEAIISQYQKGDIIMINDYHLMLLPRLIRDKIPTATIGFFLHVTFPSSEIFRCLAARQHLLRGMLGADLIAFQTHNHMRHFRQTVHRILSLEAMPKGIQLENGFVDVQAMPMGIDLGSLEQKRANPEVKEWVANLRQRYAGMKLLVGRDKLDEVQGVRQKVLAFETLLDRHPEFRGKVVLMQIALTTTSENQNLASDSLSTIISRINSRFSSLSYTPVVLLHTHELNFQQYLALLTVADAFVVTSLREGMALRTHEFIECQEERKRPLVLSEFTGSYSFSGFRSCYPCNPFDKIGTAEAMAQALTISDKEAASRWQDLHNHVISQTAQNFVLSFLTRTQRAHAEHTARPLQTIPALPSPATDLVTAFKAAGKRLILLGLENTLTFQDPKIMRDKGFEIPEEVVKLLKTLAEDERNVVYILSGLPVEGAMDKVALALPDVGLAAEEGCYVKPTPAKKGDKTEWVNMVSDVSMQWKAPCCEILHYYTERTPGSFTEERGSSIRFRYWPGNADDTELPWARRQAAEAQNHIWDSLGERFGLRIVPATRSFLILPRQASRLNVVDSILEKDKFDFVLAIGNDEHLLARLNQVKGSETVTTGRKNSDAKWRLDRGHVLRTLEELSK